MGDMKYLFSSFGCGNEAVTDWMVVLLDGAGLKTQSQLFQITPAREVELKKYISSLMCPFGLKCPKGLFDALRIAVQQKRLTFSCFRAGVLIPVLFTAPHSIHLHREGHEPHMPESFTSRLARKFANEQQLACLVWASNEKERVTEFYKCAGQPDPSNSDPNFTKYQDLGISPWTQKLRQIRGTLGPKRRCLHVDLHGCKDPDANGGSHLIVGLRAMELAGRGDVEEFRTNLQKVLAVVLQGWSVNVRPLMSLTGAREDGRCTLTQQSLSDSGGAWTHSVQLEMSKSLRRKLVNNKKMRAAMVKGIVNAWTLTGTENLQPEYFWKELVPEATKWFQECRGSCRSNQIKEQLEPDSDGVEDTSSENGRTGNSETTAAPYDIPVKEIETEILTKFTMMALRTQEVDIKVPRANNVPPIAASVQELRAWFKNAENITSCLQEKGLYY